MPGKPGSGGPVPKPSSQRRRRNKPEVSIDTVPAGAPISGDAPEPDPEWHPIALEWFESLGKSGQASFYEASDWAMARLGAEMMSNLCSSGKPSAQMLASLLAICSSLLSTEGDRRRLRLELARGPQIDADEQSSVANFADYLNRVGG